MQSWKARKPKTTREKGILSFYSLQNYLIAANDMESLQTYVMLLLGVKLS
jgi:hypothetical protein